MALNNWIDLIVFFLLFGLFLYVFIGSALTKLHRNYLLLHIIFMVWPLMQLIASTTDEHRLSYLLLAYAGLSLLGLGWLVFVLSLAGNLPFAFSRRTLPLTLPALVSVVMVLVNPEELFLTIEVFAGGEEHAVHGPLFWIMIIQLVSYAAISVTVVLLKLRKNNTFRYHKLLKTAVIGLCILFIASIADLFINLLWTSPISGKLSLVSCGMAATASYLVYAINRNRVFDIIQIVQRDVMNTMALGIVVLDEFDNIVELNRVVRHLVRMRVGDRLTKDLIKHQFKGESAQILLDLFAKQDENPLEQLDAEISLETDRQRFIIIHTAPILNKNKVILGRVLTFQDVTEMRQLVEEAQVQNELLQERNRALLTMQEELYRANEKLERMAITDSLTGCYNRRHMLQQLDKEIMGNIRYNLPFSILIFDLDHFKQVNDKYGHLTGDEVLTSTVAAVRSVLRSSDLFARYGGEEFTVYLPNTCGEQAGEIAERVRRAVELNQIDRGQGQEKLGITISGGIVCINQFENLSPDDSRVLLMDMLAAADAALYEAKGAGRNQIIGRSYLS